MIIDAFPFNDELEMLSYRLEELNDYVDKFVLFESAHTWLGDPKPLHFQENKHLFEKYLHKIDHSVFEVPFVDIDRLPEKVAQRHMNFEKSWLNEKNARMFQIQYLESITSDNDVVITADVDEIWDVDKVLNLGIPKRPLRIEMEWFIYDLEHLLWEDLTDTWWATPSMVVCSGKWMRHNPDGLRFVRGMPEFETLEKAGWHLAWFFYDEERFLNKVITGHSKDWFRVAPEFMKDIEGHRRNYQLKKVPTNLRGDRKKNFSVRYKPLEEHTHLPKKYRLLLNE